MEVPPPSANEVDAEAALTKRARKRSRYLSPPYADTEEAGGHQVWGPPPDVSAAEVLSALHAAARLQVLGVDPPVLRFLALHRNRTGSPRLLPPSSQQGGRRSDSHGAGPAIAAALEQQGHAMENAAPLEPAEADGAIRLAHLAAGASNGFANSAPAKKKAKKKSNKTSGPGQAVPVQRLGKPVALGQLPLTDIRNNLEQMISSLTRRSSSFKEATAAANSPREAKPAEGNLVGQMQGLLAEVNKKLQGASSAAHRH